MNPVLRKLRLRTPLGKADGRPEGATARVWEYVDLKPKDAIHVATAVRAGVGFLDTYDEPLIALTDRIGDPPLKIAKPGDFMQTAFDVETVEASEEREHIEEAEVPNGES
jgi:hypothetical protein